LIVEFLDEARVELLLASGRYEEEIQGLFDVVYLDDPDKLVIVAIAHHKRSPGYWRRRISSSE